MKPDGGPAFPVVFEHKECTSEQEGMTLRDYFAAKAMHALISNVNGSGKQVAGMAGDFAIHAYAQADAMIAERAK